MQVRVGPDFFLLLLQSREKLTLSNSFRFRECNNSIPGRGYAATEISTDQGFLTLCDSVCQALHVMNPSLRRKFNVNLNIPNPRIDQFLNEIK